MGEYRMGGYMSRHGPRTGALLGCFVAAFVLSAIILMVAKPRFVYDAGPKTSDVVVKNRNPWHWHRLTGAAFLCAVIVTVLCWAMGR